MVSESSRVSEQHSLPRSIILHLRLVQSSRPSLSWRHLRWLRLASTRSSPFSAGSGWYSCQSSWAIWQSRHDGRLVLGRPLTRWTTKNGYRAAGWRYWREGWPSGFSSCCWCPSRSWTDGSPRTCSPGCPPTLLQFAVAEEPGDPITSGTLLAFLLIALTFNGVAGPITEELYFRGHLLPRLERYGRWAPVINTALFTIYHFFSPWRYPAIFVGFLPITWTAWRKRSVAVSIAAHMTINIVTVLLLAAGLAAGD